MTGPEVHGIDQDDHGDDGKTGVTLQPKFDQEIMPPEFEAHKQHQGHPSDDEKTRIAS
jgi:hypothetical protein